MDRLIYVHNQEYFGINCKFDDNMLNISVFHANK